MAENKGLEAKNHNEETSAGPRVMKQLLRTPAFKDLLTLSMSDADPADTRELVKTLLWEDSAVSFSFMGSLPRDVNFLIVFLDEMGRQLQNLPPEMLREFVTQMAENLDKETLKSLPGAYTPLLNTLVWEDPATRQHIRDGALESLNAMMRVFAGAMDNLPQTKIREEEKGEQADESVELDPEALGELINSLFKWMGSVAGEDPETIRASQEKKKKFIREAMQSTDFGVMRSAIAKRAETNYPLTETMVTTMVSDPIIFANVINIIPPLINNLLKGTSAAISSLEFPPEILASAVFNLMDDLEAEEIGSIINGLCGFIGELHEGNLVLGRDEPRFRPVLQNFMDKCFNGLDEETVADAVVALFEDTEVILAVFADVMVKKPELLKKGISAFITGFNAQLRGAVYLADSLGNLSPDLYQHLGNELEEKAEFKEAGVLINALAKIANRVLDENPALLENALASVYRSVDKEETGQLCRKVLQQGYAFARKENLLAVNPEEAGRLTNSLLASYNRHMISDPQKVHNSLAAYLEQLDYEELSLAIVNTSNHFTRALETNPRLSKFIVKSVFTFVSGLIKGSLGTKNWNLLSRSAQGQTKKGRRG